MKLLFILLLLKYFYLVKSDCSCSLNVDRYKEEKEEQHLVHNKIEQSFCDLNNCNTVSLRDDVEENMAFISGGYYQLGTDDPIIDIDKEGPKKLITLDHFYLDKFEVSNKNFAEFVEDTGYKSEAEKFGDSFVFNLFLNETTKKQYHDYRVAQAPWWYKIPGANWKHPYGPDSKIQELMNHPVVHISWRDAKAYCKWRKARLPSEAEWEAACRAGKEDIIFPWGNELYPNKKHMANIWQGLFPDKNSVKDGYAGTCPVGLFEQNSFGLHNIVGNVWEWVEDTWDVNKPEEKVKKGGSYLCHRSYCYRYRCSARSHNTEDSTAGNLGFRCAKSVT